jgi:excisionase family DNA binding protein
VAEKLLTLREVEEATRLSRPTLYRRLQEGRLRGIKLDNGAWRIPEEEVLKILSGPQREFRG